jgi:hypothetical protein
MTTNQISDMKTQIAKATRAQLLKARSMNEMVCLDAEQHADVRADALIWISNIDTALKTRKEGI